MVAQPQIFNQYVLLFMDELPGQAGDDGLAL